MGVPTIIRANVDAGDTVLAEGSILRGNASAVAAAHAAETSGQILVGNGTTIASVAVSGDATLASTGALTIAASAVENSMVANSAGVGGLFVMKYALAQYSFAVDGGTAGAIVLSSNATIPDNAVVELVSYDVTTTCTSANDTATILVTLPTDGDLSTAIAINDGTNPWDSGVHAASVVTPILQKTTAARAITMTIATQDLTAGVIIFCFRYYVST